MCGAEALDDSQRVLHLGMRSRHAIRKGWGARHPGSFGSPSPQDIDGLVAMFGEVLEAFDGLESKPPEHGADCIAQGSERLWCIACVRVQTQPAHQMTTATKAMAETKLLASLS
jgi:hypothetical protein